MYLPQTETTQSPTLSLIETLSSPPFLSSLSQLLLYIDHSEPESLLTKLKAISFVFVSSLKVGYFLMGENVGEGKFTSC